MVPLTQVPSRRYLMHIGPDFFILLSVSAYTIRLWVLHCRKPNSEATSGPAFSIVPRLLDLLGSCSKTNSTLFQYKHEEIEVGSGLTVHVYCRKWKVTLFMVLWPRFSRSYLNENSSPKVLGFLDFLPLSRKANPDFLQFSSIREVLKIPRCCLLYNGNNMNT